MTHTCDHGYWLHDCAICEKRAGECDYGSCVQPATTSIVTKHEIRPMCSRHATVIRPDGAYQGPRS